MRGPHNISHAGLCSSVLHLDMWVPCLPIQSPSPVTLSPSDVRLHADKLYHVSDVTAADKTLTNDS